MLNQQLKCIHISSKYCMNKHDKQRTRKKRSRTKNYIKMQKNKEINYDNFIYCTNE